MDRNYCLIVFIVYTFVCHPVVHRKLQNVVYMKKNRCLKKRGGGAII
jgi:hypothetical protein